VGFLGNDLLFRCAETVVDVRSGRSRCDGILSLGSGFPIGKLRLGEVLDPNIRLLGVFGECKAEMDGRNG
jgi:hypothetical protein